MAEPLFFFTSDLDWASDYCIDTLLGAVGQYGIRATVFVTHASRTIDERRRNGQIELGLHPNFLPGSTHGSDVDSVIDHVCKLAPGAQGFRSHALAESTHINLAMARRGIRFDSNLVQYLEPHLTWLSHWTGLKRAPIFWEDDIHWRLGGSWRFSDYADAFFSPGLKVLNVHPFFFTMNIPTHAFYERIKAQIQTLDAPVCERERFEGPGVRTFVLEMLDAVRARGCRTLTLGEGLEQLTAGEVVR